MHIYEYCDHSTFACLLAVIDFYFCINIYAIIYSYSKRKTGGCVNR